MLVNGTYLRRPETQASCQLCQDLRIRREEEDSGFLGMPLWKMDESARNGCLICRILLEAVIELTRGFVVPSHLLGKEIVGFTIRSECSVEDGVAKPSRRVPSPLSLVLQTEYTQLPRQ
jgi:hypothetical protein